MNKVIKTTLKVINIIIVAAIVLSAAVVICTKLFGVQMFTVLSGSMEPEYPTGSLILVQKAEPSELEKGDVITFKLGDSTTATHRIIEVIPPSDSGGELSFRTKGDANDIEDASPVIGKNIIGKPFITIPKAGFIAVYLQTAAGKKSAILIGAALLLFVCVTDLLTNDRKKEKE